jgi:hypothetical protein
VRRPDRFFFEDLFSGENRWGMLRLFVLVGTLLLSVLALGLHNLRFLVGPVGIMVIVLLWGAMYIRDIYELKSLGAALNYLLACLFSLRMPRLIIEGGASQTRPGEENLIETIGGPGTLVIKSGNVVLCETMQGPSSIHVAGERYIRRFERIHQVISLEEQQGISEDVTAITKDGILVTIPSLKYRYRVYSGRQKNPAGDPFGYSIPAVVSIGYQRNVSADGLLPWESQVKTVVESVITDYINRHTLDTLTAPYYTGSDPRGEIRKIFESPALTSWLRNIGAELVWYEIGHFEFGEDVARQRLSTWQTKWDGESRYVRAYGEAKRKAYQELGRAEAQAEMLMSIIQALEDIQLSGRPEENLRNVFLARTARVLEAMTETNPNSTQGQSSQKTG